MITPAAPTAQPSATKRVGLAGPVRQFLLLTGCVLLAGMTATGVWINGQIQGIVTQNAGSVTALYVDAMITPVAQELDLPGGIGPDARARLDQILRQGELSRQVSAFKLWDSSAQVVYSTRPELVGRVATDNQRLKVALKGQVHAALRQVTMSGEVPVELMEAYSPVHSSATGEVIGVAEFYTGSESLRADLLRSRVRSWAAVGLMTLAMFAGLYTLLGPGGDALE